MKKDSVLPKNDVLKLTLGLEMRLVDDDAPARHEARVSELLAANNALIERARDAESKLAAAVKSFDLVVSSMRAAKSRDHAEFGWLIERAHPQVGLHPQFISLSCCPYGRPFIWSYNVDSALRFSRKDDADAFRAHHQIEYAEATQHGWGAI